MKLYSRSFFVFVYTLSTQLAIFHKYTMLRMIITYSLVNDSSVHGMHDCMCLKTTRHIYVPLSNKISHDVMSWEIM